MSYFKNVQEGDEVFGLVFGKGVVTSVWGEGHYTFEVEYENGSFVPYTEDGIPGWSGNLDFQTVFYADDINISDLDFTPADEILTPKKIIKLRNKKKLEIRCPSGIWQPVDKCPGYVMEYYLEEGKFYLFRKAK